MTIKVDGEVSIYKRPSVDDGGADRLQVVIDMFEVGTQRWLTFRCGVLQFAEAATGLARRPGTLCMTPQSYNLGARHEGSLVDYPKRRVHNISGIPAKLTISKAYGSTGDRMVIRLDDALSHLSVEANLSVEAYMLGVLGDQNVVCDLKLPTRPDRLGLKREFDRLSVDVSHLSDASPTYRDDVGEHARAETPNGWDFDLSVLEPHRGTQRSFSNDGDKTFFHWNIFRWVWPENSDIEAAKTVEAF